MVKKIIKFLMLILILTIAFILGDVLISGADNITFFGFKHSDNLTEAFENFNQYVLLSLVTVGITTFLQLFFKSDN